MICLFFRSARRVVLLFRAMQAMRAMLAKHHTQKPSGTYDMPMMLYGELFILYLFILDSVTCNIFVLAAFHTIRTGTHTISFHWTVYRIWSVYLGFSLVMFTLSYMHMECIAIEKREKKSNKNITYAQYVPWDSLKSEITIKKSVMSGAHEPERKRWKNRFKRKYKPPTGSDSDEQIYTKYPKLNNSLEKKKKSKKIHEFVYQYDWFECIYMVYGPICVLLFLELFFWVPNWCMCCGCLCKL